MKQPTCNLCGQIIRWVKTSNDGSLPIDPDPHPEGHLVLDQYGRIGPAAGERGRPDRSRRYRRHDCKER